MKNVSKSTMAKPLGKAIKMFRTELRLTQGEFADLIPGRISQPYMSKLEAGDLFPRKDCLEAIVKVLGCSYRELWARAENLANVDLDSRHSSGYIDCLVAAGDSIEKVEAMHNATKDTTISRLYALGYKLKKDRPLDLSEAKYLDNEVDQLPAENLRVFAKALAGLLVEACERCERASPGRGVQVV